MKIVSSIMGLAALISSCLSITLFVLVPQKAYLVNGMWVATAVFFLVWIFLNRASILRFFTQKSTLYGANLALIVAMVFGILFTINFLAGDYSWRKDFTRSGVNSLSPQSVKILKDLQKDIKVYYFNSLQEKEKNEPLFKNYVYQSKHFQYQFVDTGKQPTLTQSMEVKRNDTIVFALDSKKVKVEGATEEKITNGLIKLLSSKEKIVYFLSGHNERSITSADTDGNGFSLAKAELEKQGYTVKELSLLSTGKIPEDASVLAIIAPQSAFFPKEMDILSAWIKSDGRILTAFDLDIPSSGLPKGAIQAAALLKPYGIEVHDKMLVDPTSRAANVEPQILLGFAASKEHPITKDFPSSAMGVVANFFFPLTTYLTHQGAENFDITTLAKTSPQAWAVTDWAALKKGLVAYQKDKDHLGEMDLAYAVEAKKSPADQNSKGPRIVAFANARFAVNEVLDKAANRDLFLNSVAWLTNDEQLISIRAKDQDSDQLQANGNVLNFVFIVTVLFIPITAMIAGIMVWWRRSKQ